MRAVKAGEIAVDRCESCRGLWFDTLELDRVAKDRQAVAAVDSTDARPNPKRPAAMHCPRDKSRLITMHALGQPHIAYESCKVCGGAFLDAGELKDLSEITILERLKRVFG